VAKKESKGSEDESCYGCRPDEWGEDSDKVWAAIDESVRRFVKVNQENIRRSGKEKIASASYSGGMIDTLMIVKNALGSMGIEHALMELERWHRRGPPQEPPKVEITVRGAPGSAKASEEVARQLQAKISKYMEEKKRTGSKLTKDPMYA
jgi:hypothetical protein